MLRSRQCFPDSQDITPMWLYLERKTFIEVTKFEIKKIEFLIMELRLVSLLTAEKQLFYWKTSSSDMSNMMSLCLTI